MSKFLRIAGLCIFFLFEVYAGLQLINDPVTFTNNVIIVFGIIMLIIGVLSLIRALRAKSSGLAHRLTLFGAVLDLIIGVVCVAGSKYIVDMIPVLAMVYGFIMVIMGINKVRNYAVLRDLGFRRSWLVLLSALLTIVLGAIIFLNPFLATELVWTYIGVFLIVEGVMDLIAFLFGLIIA